MTLNDYWIIRGAKQREILLDESINFCSEELAKQYLQLLKNTTRDLEKMFDLLVDKAADGKLLINDLYRYNYFYEFLSELSERLEALGIQESAILSSHLLELYKKTSVLVSELNTGVNVRAAEEAIKIIWCSDGQHWSDRIWKNKEALQQLIQDGIIETVSKGTSKAELVKRLQKDLNVGYYQSERIARTELNFVQNQAALDKYKEAGIEYFEVLSNQSDDNCLDQNGNKFRVDEAAVGINCPPFHPNCRCTVLGVL